MQKTIIATVDVVLLTLQDGLLKVALQRRQTDPFKTELALPGGYVRPETDADTMATARRVLLEKTALAPDHLEQVGCASSPVRDPRGWSISVVYLALVPIAAVEANSANNFEIFSATDFPPLAFDHKSLVGLAVQRLRNKAAYSTLPLGLMPDEFTLSELQQVYEQVMGIPLSKATFRARLSPLIREEGKSGPERYVLQATGKAKAGMHRPAQLYRKILGFELFENSLI